MKKIIIIIAMLFSTCHLYAQDGGMMVKRYLKTSSIKLYKPLFSDETGVNGESFNAEDLIKYKYIHQQYSRPDARDVLEWEDFGLYKWKRSKAKEGGVVSIKSTKAKYQLAYLVFYLNNDNWADIDFQLTSAQMLEVFIDGEKIGGKYTLEEEGAEKVLTVNAKLDANNHFVLIKTLLSLEKNRKWAVSCELKLNNKENDVKLSTGLESQYYMDLNHLLHGINIESTQISTAGDYYFIKYHLKNKEGKQSMVTDVRRLADHSTVQLFYGAEVSYIKWTPFDNVLTFTTTVGDKSWIWEYDMDNGKRFPIATNLDHLHDYAWAPNGEFLVISRNETEEENSDLTHSEANSDLWPWFRERNNLAILDVISGIKTPLTYGQTSNELEAISPNGQYILFCQHVYDDSQKPYSRQILIQYDRLNRRIDTIWNHFGNSKIKYSPDGKNLIVLAASSFFAKAGDVQAVETSDDYKQQAYIFNLRRKRVTPITKDFDFSILNANWDYLDDKYIFFTVSEDTYVNEYQYNIKTEEFIKLTSGIDVIDEVSYSKEKPLMVYNGTSISSPRKAFIMDVSIDARHILDYPEESFFDKVEFGLIEDWNFKNNKGDTIEGRIYYPPNFDKEKEYPMIVYYYGGTTPTERSFRGRYPKNLYAAKGYIVYVLQPSSIAEYGNDYSVEHIDNWGKTVAKEILHGTRLLCQTHPFIDSTKVGCMGTSYGGFMTIYLTSTTNFYKTAISHTGISSVSSYWGKGYWEYLYNQLASDQSFSWNKKDSESPQSLLTGADSVNTSVLLLHDNQEANVSSDESMPFYTALKMQDREVELKEIDKDPQQITDDNQRILWQKTIISWFDKNLKNQPDWWYHLYPKKN